MSWTSPPAETDWDAAVAALTSGEKVLLLAHVSPDADALGSALAVGLALEARGVDVVVSFGDEPFALPRVLRSLPGQHLLVAPESVTDHPVVASFDVSSIERLGVLRATAEAAASFLAVDHHASYTGFAPLSLVDVKAPATAVLALELVDRLGVELTDDIATAVYSGMVTDTGSFKYVGTTPETHEVAARLLRTGMRHDLVARHIYDDEPFAALRLLGAALDRAVLEEEAVGGLGLVWTVVPAADRAALGLPLDAVERVIDVLRIATEAEIAGVLKQDDTGAWRVSLRSKGQVDVAAVAMSLGGGGHRYAAGFTGHGEPGEVLRSVRTALDKAPHLPA
ncbi:MAG TPA: bifunctional oligoribonuclease/PAP phosphatase NrnA [Candidatus Nanopelagicales bacterium]|nr:bifunctional oligoribonuclease/PAP phosphatase NrnA [Candidatus Nanopelagicales bacterium]